MNKLQKQNKFFQKSTVYNFLLDDERPTKFTIDGELFPIRHDFKTWINISYILDNECIINDTKIEIIENMIYVYTKPANKTESINKITWFLRCGQIEKLSRKTSAKLFCFFQDSLEICASVRLAKDMHWFDFIIELTKALCKNNALTNKINLRRENKEQLIRSDDEQWIV